MGFEVPRNDTRLRLVFDDPGLGGLEVVCRMVSLGTFLELMDLGAASTLGDVRVAYKRFGDEVVESWNLTQDGQPVEASGAAVLGLDKDFARMIFTAWQRNILAVPSPLEAAAVTPDIPMLTLNGR